MDEKGSKTEFVLEARDLKIYSEEAQLFAKTVVQLLAMKDVKNLEYLTKTCAHGMNSLVARASLPPLSTLPEEEALMTKKVWGMAENFTEDGEDSSMIVAYVAAREMVKMQTHIDSLEAIIAHGEKK